MVIRPADPSEYTTLGDLCVAAYAADGLGPPGYQRVLRDVAGRAASAEILVAADDGDLLGTVTLVLDPGPMSEIATPDEGEFRMLAVAPQARGKGAGTALVRACAGQARAGGRRALVCSSQPSMRSAHAIYERLGFVRDPGRDWSPVPGVELLAFQLPLR